MNSSAVKLLFTFLDSTAVTAVKNCGARKNSDPSVAIYEDFVSDKKAAGELPAAFPIIKFLLRLCVGDPAGARDLAMSFVVIEEFHLVIGMRVRYWMIVHGTEPGRIVRHGQRSLRGVHCFVQGRAGWSLRHGKDSKRTAIGIGNANVIGDHR